MSAEQTTIDQENIAFWNELCGSSLAEYLGITDASPASLKKFDDWFLNYYPYVFSHIPFSELRGKDALEVGLGYGTVSQLLAQNGANYTGLDIATGPVEMANHRFKQLGLKNAQARQGSILSAPFPDASFDMIVTIGCLHHTGDIDGAISECHRMLRPDGKLVVMLYYAYSYRRWVQARSETFEYFRKERAGYRGVVKPINAAEKWDYDHNLAGQAAPHTDFISVTSLRTMCSDFTSFKYRLENINNEPPFSRWQSREPLLKTIWPGLMGLEIYATVTK